MEACSVYLEDKIIGGGTAIVAGGAGTNTTLSQACYGNADLQQSLVSDTIINNTVAAVFNFFFGGQ